MTGPYATGSGSYPVETSRDREEFVDSSGVTKRRRETVLDWLYARGERGGTGKELRTDSSLPEDLRDYANGTSTLTALYAEGAISRLEERRGGGYVYVHQKFIAGRPTILYEPAFLRRFTPEERSAARKFVTFYSLASSREGLDADERRMLDNIVSALNKIKGPDTQ